MNAKARTIETLSPLFLVYVPKPVPLPSSKMVFPWKCPGGNSTWKKRCIATAASHFGGGEEEAGGRNYEEVIIVTIAQQGD